MEKLLPPYALPPAPTLHLPNKARFNIFLNG
jgi:hypothetical protein